MFVNTFNLAENTLKSAKKSKTTMFTPVILVCVHDLQEDIVISHDYLYSIFSTYGEVLRILIFERSNTFKAFLEYSNTKSALAARKNLNRALLFQGRCRMSIYPSNLNVIKFQNNYPGGIDYTQVSPPFAFPNQFDQNIQANIQPILQVPTQRMFNIRTQTCPPSFNYYNQGGSSKSSPLEMNSPSNNRSMECDDDDGYGEDILQMINRHQTETRYENEAKDFDNENEDDGFNNLVQNAFSNKSPFGTFQIESFNSGEKQPLSFDDSSSYSYLKRTRLPCFPQSHSELTANYEHGSLSGRSYNSAFSDPTIARLCEFEDLPSAQDLHETTAEDEITSEDEKENQNTGNLPKMAKREVHEEDAEKQSPVLHVLGIENKEVSTKMLFNVFSNFGNIVKLIFIKTRAVALVEFETVQGACLAKKALDNVNFFGKMLRITYSKYPTIKLQPGQAEKYPEQLIIGEEGNFRFKQGKNTKVAPASVVLRVSNLSNQICKDKKAINNLFGEFGQVKGVRSMSDESILVKMKSIEDCLKAIAKLHDSEYDGKRLEVSFSLTKA